MRRATRVRQWVALASLGCLSMAGGCAGTRGAGDTTTADEDLAAFVAETSATSVLGIDAVFAGSPYEDVGLDGLFPVRGPQQCQVAVLQGGEDSFALRVRTLEQARRSIRIQALVFTGDETGLRIADLLKRRRAEGLDVRVIVDGLSNPSLQTQWMYFDLKQHGVEVQGYEAMGLQWLNEVPLPRLVPHTDPDALDRRYHEKMWIVDGETPDALAVTGGLNIANEYFRADPANPDAMWRDQDVVVRGGIVQDMVAAFDRNFEYFAAVKRSRGILDTDLYWNATRAVLDRAGRLPVHYRLDPRVAGNVDALASRRPSLEFQGATCRFLQQRPRLRETYIQQAYLKLIERAEHEILIANAYFVPTPALVTALTDAGRRCVSVRLISNSPVTNDLPEITLVGRGYYRRLLEVNDSPEVRACPNPDAGLRIWEWFGQSAEDSVRRQGTMHSKFAVIDGRRALVGSYNLDPRSEKLNSESALVFLQPGLATQLRRKFLEEDLRYSREVTAEMAVAFESPARIVERFRKSLGQAFEEHL